MKDRVRPSAAKCVKCKKINFLVHLNSVDERTAVFLVFSVHVVGALLLIIFTRLHKIKKVCSLQINF